MSTRSGGAWLRAGVVFAVVVGIDQATKAIVRSSIPRGGSHRFFLGIDLVNTRNKGVAFGLLSGGGGVVIAVIAVALVALAAYFATHADKPLLWLPTGLLLGGAVGNLLDRVRGDAVTDFIDLPLWPPFNVADMAITFGVLSLLYALEAPRVRRGRNDPAQDDVHEAS
jgi:signal peptidase II